MDIKKAIADEAERLTFLGVDDKKKFREEHQYLVFKWTSLFTKGAEFALNLLNFEKLEITEKERNKSLMLLLQKLVEHDDLESIDHLKNVIADDKPSIKKSFKIMTELYYNNKNNIK